MSNLSFNNIFSQFFPVDSCAPSYKGLVNAIINGLVPNNCLGFLDLWYKRTSDITKNRHLEGFLISQDQHTSWRVYAPRIFSSKHFEGFPNFFSKHLEGFLKETISSPKHLWSIFDETVSFSKHLEGSRMPGFLQKRFILPILKGFWIFLPNILKGFWWNQLLPNILKGFWSQDFFFQTSWRVSDARISSKGLTTSYPAIAYDFWINHVFLKGVWYKISGLTTQSWRVSDTKFPD